MRRASPPHSEESSRLEANLRTSELLASCIRGHGAVRGPRPSPERSRCPVALARCASGWPCLTTTTRSLTPSRCRGAGWYEREFEPFGYPYPGTGGRFAVLEESVEVIAGLLQEGPFDHQGRRFRLHGAYNHPRPVDRADGVAGPPIWIGGKGGDRLLR